jgi:hypothetical protein
MSTALGTVEPDVDLDDGGSVVLQNLLGLAIAAGVRGDRRHGPAARRERV